MKHFKGKVTFTYDIYAEDDDDIKDTDDVETEIRLKLDDLMAADERLNIEKYDADIEVEEIDDEND